MKATGSAAALAFAAAMGLAAAPAPVLPPAAKVLAPTLFAGWQTRNVAGPVVVRDAAGGWRLYYSGSATEQVNEAAWDLWATGLATSRDGRRWVYAEGGYEPVLAGRRFREGEVVDPAQRALTFDSMEARVGTVVRAGGRWWMWYTGWNGDDRTTAAGGQEKVHFRIGAAQSTDGARWIKRPGAAGAGAVLGLDGSAGATALSVGSPSVLREGTAFRMWHETSDGATWRIAQATSPDGVAWTGAGVVLAPGPAGALDERGVRHPVIVALPGGYELWYQGRSRASPEFHVLRARSVDGRAWQKVAGEIALHPEPRAESDEDLRVGSVRVRPDGRRDVFFSKETTTTRAAAFGAVSSRTTSIYTEVVTVRE